MERSILQGAGASYQPQIGAETDRQMNGQKDGWAKM